MQICIKAQNYTLDENHVKQSRFLLTLPKESTPIALSFVQENTWPWIFEFLQIPHSKTSQTMFDFLPGAIRAGSSLDAALKQFPGHLEYMQKLQREPIEFLLNLATCAAQLDIPALCHLVACSLAMYMSSKPLHTWQNHLQIDKKYQPAVMQKYAEVVQGQGGSASGS